LTTTINEFRKEESEQQSKMSKVEEEIVQHKASKNFIDMLSIASGSKQPIDQKSRKRMKE
jgi:hypothetical protein